MVGDILGEQRLTLSQAARLIGVHVATIHRWRLRGVRGVRLSTAVIGGLRYTSRERLDTFIAATTAAADGETAPIRTSRQRQADQQRAGKVLDEAGIA